MIFTEWVERHGIESARYAFGVGDHMVLTVRAGRNVVGQCGRWVGSEPLANPTRNPDVETACQRLRDAVCNCFDTEEIIYETNPNVLEV